jgi:hypothetical protein
MRSATSATTPISAAPSPQTVRVFPPVRSGSRPLSPGAGQRSPATVSWIDLTFQAQWGSEDRNTMTITNC